MGRQCSVCEQKESIEEIYTKNLGKPKDKSAMQQKYEDNKGLMSKKDHDNTVASAERLHSGQKK